MCQTQFRFAALHQSHSVRSHGVKIELSAICVQRTAKLMQCLNWLWKGENANANFRNHISMFVIASAQATSLIPPAGKSSRTVPSREAATSCPDVPWTEVPCR